MHVDHLHGDLRIYQFIYFDSKILNGAGGWGGGGGEVEAEDHMHWDFI